MATWRFYSRQVQLSFFLVSFSLVIFCFTDTSWDFSVFKLKHSSVYILNLKKVIPADGYFSLQLEYLFCVFYSFFNTMESKTLNWRVQEMPLSMLPNTYFLNLLTIFSDPVRQSCVIMESKQLKYLYREQDLEVSTFCLVFSSLRPCTKYILLSTILLQLDSWTNIFQGSVINCADTKTHWTGWISFHLFANWQNVLFFFCSSSVKLLSIFPTAFLQLRVCPDIQKQGSFKARYRLICQPLCSAPRRWDTGCSSLRRWHQGAFSSL